MVKVQRKINFINDCNSIVDFADLEKAILWYADNPTISKKRIFLSGSYPAVSIGEEKIHIHRLLMMYWLNTKLPSEFSVHHIDGNRLNATKENLSVMLNSTHNSNHNKGKNVSDKVVEHIVQINHSRKGSRQPYKRQDVLPDKVKEMKERGYSTNMIAKELHCDWSTIKAREKDIYDNPELLEVKA